MPIAHVNGVRDELVELRRLLFRWRFSCGCRPSFFFTASLGIAFGRHLRNRLGLVSSLTTNVDWAWINLVVGYILSRADKVSSGNLPS